MEKIEKKTEKKKKKGLLARIKKKKMELLALFIFTALVVVVLWPYITVTVEGGEVGVYYSKFFGGTVVDKSCDEGLNLKWPWDKIIIYDARTQSMDYSITALAMGGLSVNVQMTVVWHIKKAEVGALHKSMGPEYSYNVIDPAVVSAVRSIIGSYEQSSLYDGNPLHLQDEVMELLNNTLKNAPFEIQYILVREVKLPDQMIAAISEKFVAEQNVLAERYRVLESVEKFKRSYVDAEAVRIEQSVVNEGMSEAYLRYLGIEATKELAKSNNAKLVIIGDKDGLPLMMNVDDWTTSENLPDGLVPGEYIRDGEEGGRMTDFVDSYNRIQGTVNQLSDVLGELFNSFPEADESMSNLTIPQVNKVPSSE